MISTVHIHAHTSYRYSVKNLKLVLNCMYSESWSHLCRNGMLGTSPILGVCVVPFSWFRFTLTCVCVCVRVFVPCAVIQGILESVRWLRKLNTDQEGRRPGLDGVGGRGGLFGGRRSQDTSQPVEDEFDQYRAKYRLFDSALFIMSPDNRLRRFCRAVLTRQMSEPPFVRTRLTPVNLIKNRFSYYIRYLVSRLPYFSWLMVMITLSAIAVQLAELQTRFGRPANIILNTTTTSDVRVPVDMEPVYFWTADFLFVLFTLVELTLKILANGFFLNPDAAIRSVWDVMDWVVVISSAAVLILNTSVCGAAVRQTLALSHLPLYLVVLLCVRALRPLRAISLVPQMRRVIYDVLLGWKQLLFGVLVLLFAIFMFASLGVQLFAGDYPEGPQAFCNDPSSRSLAECLRSPTVRLRITTSREFLPNSNYSPSILVPTVWYTHRRDFDFDNTLKAMLTMFEVLTLEGWLDVRDMLVRDPVSPGIPSTQEAWYMAVFLHIFIFFGVNIGLQLFVGIVVNNFNANKPGNTALLSVGQKRWTDLVLRISLLRPVKRPTPPEHNRFRLFLYRIVIHRRFTHFSTVMILLQSFCFCLPWSTGRSSATVTLISLVIVFALYFTLEQCVKMLAFGPKGYFGSWRTIADTLISLLGLCYIVWALVVLAHGYSSVTHQTRTDLANFAVSYAVLKCFTILGKYSIMQNLSITVARTLIGSTPLLFVLFLIILTYAFVGAIIFSNLRTGEEISFSRINFDGAFPSFSLAFRVMTGEDWHHLMRDAMIGNHYCSKLDGNCGNVVAAAFWFITYYILITVFLLNIIIAHLLENFSIFYNEDDTSISHAVIKDFRENWLHFDKTAQGTIKSSRIKLFLRTLRLPHYYTYSLTEVNGIKFKIRDQVHPLTDSLILREMAEELQRGPHGGGGGGGGGGKSLLSKQLSEEMLINEEEGDHSFQSVLKMLAYRAEDISQRLEPQELYDRQELEESIQFDVAEECILKWIKKYVKPIVLERQDDGQSSVEENQRRYPPPPRMDSLWPIEGTDAGLSMTVDDTDDDEMEFTSLSSNPMLRRKWLGSPSLPTSEEFPEPPPRETREDQQASHEERLVTQSYSRLAQMSLTPFTQGGGARGEDRWHDWFRMQREWSENVDSSHQNYFDDCL
ncbi:Sodium leak channel non-selective protein [Geodia barretti]|uniref:Sodium leak channel non-selective protein n=1 Tax=Geodia barretti TaxID=519541 RepID=A0AA35SXH7_GEOBA|nr:Sodium leak channel non-selective protein [Geodia barretti]